MVYVQAQYILTGPPKLVLNIEQKFGVRLPYEKVFQSPFNTKTTLVSIHVLAPLLSDS